MVVLFIADKVSKRIKNEGKGSVVELKTVENVSY